MLIRFVGMLFLVLPGLISCAESAVDYKHPETSGLGKVVRLREDAISARKALVWSVPLESLEKWCADRGLKTKTGQRDVAVESVVYFLDEHRAAGDPLVRDVVADTSNMVPFGAINDAVVFYYSEDTLPEYRIVYDKISGTAFFWSSSN